ncbi:MAG: S8 family serine peptidase, partial [Anaerolineae bacterium]|nr:S8 family serine peptidase [Anaerolineae bacterium]
MTNSELVLCAICGRVHEQAAMQDVDWLPPDVLARLLVDNPSWRRSNGACPACVQDALLQILLEKGEITAMEVIQSVWPLDAEAAFGVLPTPLRMRADPRFTGKGVTIAFIDSGFYPHADLIRPKNRIKAWIEAGREEVRAQYFDETDVPTWDGWNDGMPSHWHGLMTSTSAAGNGWRSHGFYRGIACDAELVLIQVIDAEGHITNESIARALHWLEMHGAALGVRVVNLSLGGDPVSRLAGNPIDSAIQRLVKSGIAVTAAAGNSGERRLNPPATAPEALTVGGLDDHNLFERTHLELWHSNYGKGIGGVIKPEVVAPSIWVVAPVLPGSEVERDGVELFSKRIYEDSPRAQEIAARKLVTPFYQHVDGTSFAAPIVASILACMFEANPALTPYQAYDILLHTAHRIPGVPVERQGYGAVEAG